MGSSRLRWPKIPTRLEGLAGPITVTLVRRVRVAGVACWGSWQSERRAVALDCGAPREHQWRTLFHELTHSALDDSGLGSQLSEAGNEAICEAMASLHVRLMRERLASECGMSP